MSETRDGGPAFPHRWEEVYQFDGRNVNTGMSLRDYFAAQAMAGLCTCEGQIDRRAASHGEDDVPRWLADCAYAVADAMLAARTPHVLTPGED